MSGLSTEKSNEYVDKKLKTDGDELGKSFKSILSDFDVMPYLIGLVIALSFNKLLNRIVHFISIKLFNTQNDLLEAVVEFTLTIVIIYFFIYEFYYKYLVNEDISKEKIVKTAINETRIEEAKKEIKKDPETKNNIENDIEFETFDKVRLFTNV